MRLFRFCVFWVASHSTIVLDSQWNMFLELLGPSLHVSGTTLSWKYTEPVLGAPWWNSFKSMHWIPLENNGRCSWNFLWQFLGTWVPHYEPITSHWFIECFLNIYGKCPRSLYVSLSFLYEKICGASWIDALTKSMDWANPLMFPHSIFINNQWKTLLEFSGRVPLHYWSSQWRPLLEFPVGNVIGDSHWKSMGRAPWIACANSPRLPGQTPVVRNVPGTVGANYILMKSIEQIDGKLGQFLQVSLITMYWKI